MSKMRKVYCEYENYPKASYPANEYPDVDVPNAEQEGPIVYKDPCQYRHGSFTFDWAPQPAGPTVKYTDAEHSITQPTITPDSCLPKLTYECDGTITRFPFDSDGVAITCSDVIIGPDPNNPTGPPKLTVPLSLTDYTDPGKKPGTYCITIKATNAEDLTNVPAESKTSQVCFILEDPCNPPDKITVPPLENQSYTIADPSATPYLHADFQVVPNVCELRYVYTETKFTDDAGNQANAITRSDKTFNFFYNADLSPIKPVA